jgi:hypothetical protein
VKEKQMENLQHVYEGKEDCIIGWIDIGKIKTYISIITNQTFNCHVTSECLEVESVVW